MSSKQHFCEFMMDKGKAVLPKSKNKPKVRGVETLLLAGDPVDQIVKVANEGCCALALSEARV